MKINKVLIGSDPELFLRNQNEIVSAEGLIGGTKHEPKLISDEGHAIQEDNIMVEFNIPPSNTSNKFKDNLNFVLNYLAGIAALHGLELDYSASAVLDEKYLQTKQAKRFGCEPDYNVYLRAANEPPCSSTNLRTCGGHIHVGYENPSQETTEYIIKSMDLFLGVPSVILDKDDRRKEMYGKAGCFRFKEYGCEYRTLSNFWLKTDKLKEWAFNSTINALNFIQDKENLNFLKEFEEDIVNCINNADKDLAQSILDKTKELNLINKKELV